MKLEIEVPEGYKIKLVKEDDSINNITWDDILDTIHNKNVLNIFNITPNNSFTIKKVQSYCKLYCIARYFNQNWRATEFTDGWSIIYDIEHRFICDAKGNARLQAGVIYFRNLDDAKKAIQLMGDDLYYLY